MTDTFDNDKKNTLNSIIKEMYIIDDVNTSQMTHTSNMSIDDELHEDVSDALSRILNKYSGNAEQKHLNQLYDLGILSVNKHFDKDKLTKKLKKIINERSHDPIEKVAEFKRKSLINAFKRGIEDAMSDDYRKAYDKNNKYQYNKEKIIKRGYIDGVIDKYST